MKLRTGLWPADRVGVGHIRQHGREAFHASVAEAEATARQTRPGRARGERDRRPDRLLAVVAALQRPVDVDEGARGGHLARQGANFVGGNFAQAGGPVGRLRDTVLVAKQIVAEAIEAGAVAREEVRVVQSLDDQRVREREHQRSIAMRARRDPFRVEERGRVVAHRADVAEFDARGLGLSRASRASYARRHRRE